MQSNQIKDILIKFNNSKKELIFNKEFNNKNVLNFIRFIIDKRKRFGITQTEFNNAIYESKEFKIEAEINDYKCLYIRNLFDKNIILLSDIENKKWFFNTIDLLLISNEKLYYYIDGTIYIENIDYNIKENFNDIIYITEIKNNIIDLVDKNGEYENYLGKISKIEYKQGFEL